MRKHYHFIQKTLRKVFERQQVINTVDLLIANLVLRGLKILTIAVFLGTVIKFKLWIDIELVLKITLLVIICISIKMKHSSHHVLLNEPVLTNRHHNSVNLDDDFVLTLSGLLHNSQHIILNCTVSGFDLYYDNFEKHVP